MRLCRHLCLIFAVILAAFYTVRGDDPVVTISTSDPAPDPVDGIIKSPKDRDAEITCAVYNKPTNSDVKWMKQNPQGDGILTPISTDLNSQDPFKFSLVKPSQTEWRLTIQNAQVTDEGRYMCEVQTGPQIYVRAIAHLRVTEVPQIADLQTSSDTIAKEGDNLLLTCNATGRPFPIVSWSRMSGALLPNGGEELQEYHLKIDGVRARDAGVYKCNARNSVGSISRKINLAVKFAPQIRADSPKVGQMVGYHKDLMCYVTAYPQPNIDSVSWMHVNNPIKPGIRHEIINIQGAYNKIMSILHIKYVQPSDFGIYRCSARNEQGGSEARVELVASDIPTAGRDGRISASSSVRFSFITVLILLTTHLLLSHSW